MITRSYDQKDFDEAIKLSPGHSEEDDYGDWVNDPKNIMLIEDDNVGCAHLEYPGVYSVHWFFRSAKGRSAITLARKMCGEMFNTYGAQTLQGLTPTDNKPARWLAKQVGLKSYGFVTYPDNGPHELMYITKKEWQEINGS